MNEWNDKKIDSANVVMKKRNELIFIFVIAGLETLLAFL